MCVRECVCVYVWVSFVVCVQFSSIWLFLNGGGRGLTCVRLCLTTIACTLKWQQAVFPLWSRSGRIQVGFNSCRFEQCPLQFRRSRNATEHLTDTRLRFESYDLLIWHSSSWKPETEHVCVCVFVWIRCKYAALIHRSVLWRGHFRQIRSCPYRKKKNRGSRLDLHLYLSVCSSGLVQAAHKNMWRFADLGPDGWGRSCKKAERIKTQVLSCGWPSLSHASGDSNKLKWALIIGWDYWTQGWWSYGHTERRNMLSSSRVGVQTVKLAK